MSKEERIQNIRRAFNKALDDLAEGRHSKEVHAAIVKKLLDELREIKTLSEVGAGAISPQRLVA